MITGSCNDVAIPIFPQDMVFKYKKKVRITFNGSLEVINRIVWLEGWGCSSWPGVYKSSHTQPAKIIVTCSVKLIKVVINNLHPFIANSNTIMDSVLELSNADPYKVLVPFGKIYQFLVVSWVAEIRDVLIVDGEKFFNMFTFIVN